MKNKQKIKQGIFIGLILMIILTIISLGIFALINKIKTKSVQAGDFINNPVEMPKIATVSASRANLPDYSALEVLNGTRMEDAKEHIIRASEYYELPIELYLGIASAESSFNRFKCFNPWGIDTGRGNDPRCYQSWEQSVNGFSALIKYYYFAEGKITAEQLVRKYVGYQNETWIINVKQYYK